MRNWQPRYGNLYDIRMTGTLLIAYANPEVLRGAVESASKTLRLALQPISEGTFLARRGNAIAKILLGFFVTYAAFKLTFVSPEVGVSHVLFEMKRPWWTTLPFWVFGADSVATHMHSVFNRMIDGVENSLRSGGVKVQRAEVVLEFEPCVATLNELEARH